MVVAAPRLRSGAQPSGAHTSHRPRTVLPISATMDSHRVELDGRRLPTTPGGLRTVLATGDPRTRARLVTALQRTHGNSHVQRLVATTNVASLLSSTKNPPDVAQRDETEEEVEEGGSILDGFGEIATDLADATSGISETVSAGVEDIATAGAGLVGADGGERSDPTDADLGGGETSPVLRPGMAGAAVTVLQERLGVLGFDAPITGVFDAATAAAVSAFQAASGLVADGIAGALTLAGLGQATDEGDATTNAGGSAALADLSATQSANDSGDECQPFESKAKAERVRDALNTNLLPLLQLSVGSAVIPLWKQYLFGGAAPQNLTSGSIISSFALSGVSEDAGTLTAEAVKTEVELQPELPDGTHRVAEFGDPGRLGVLTARLAAIANGIIYDTGFTIEGNIAGGIGTDQLGKQVGAQPSPQNDSRNVGGTFTLTTLPNGRRRITVRPRITVFDTIDVCPGDKGSLLERNFTVPMSRCEASRVSGDVPFSVSFSTREEVRDMAARTRPPKTTEPDLPEVPGRA